MNINMREYVDFDGGTRHDAETIAAAVRATRQASSAAAQREAERWLRDHDLLVDGESTGECMRRLSQYRARLAKTPKPGPREWAQRLIERNRAGEHVGQVALDMACDVLELPRVVILRRPDPPAVRPDARDMQAGDVDTAIAGADSEPWGAWA